MRSAAPAWPAAPDRLDPVGRFRLPRRATTLRLVLVAGLLLTGAGVLYAADDPPGTDPLAATDPPADPPAATDPPAAVHTPRPGTPDAGTSDPGTPDPGTGPVTRPTAGGPAPRLPIPSGLVGVPVSLASPASLAMLRPGDRVDLLAVPAAGGDPAPLAGAAPVLAVDPGAAALLLALTPEQGRAVVSTPATSRFAVIVRR